MAIKVLKSQLIEVINPGIAGGNTATKIQFPDFPYLRFKKILGIEILTGSDISVTPTGKTPISGAQMKTAFMTFYLDDAQSAKNTGEWLQLIPVTLMHRVQNNVIPPTALPAAPGVQYSEPFVRQMYELNKQVIYWEKCYLNLGTAMLNTTDVSFPFVVYFMD